MRKSVLVAGLLVLTGNLLSAGIPSSVDNSLSKYFPPIIDQKGGSCAQASMIGYTFTYEMNRLLDRDASLPENRYSYFYTWNFVNEGENQGSLSWDGISIGMKNGIMSEEDFPPQSSYYEFRWESGYDKYFRAMHYMAQWFMTLDVTTREGIDEAREYLASGGVLGFSGQSTGWTMDTYKGPSETGYDCILTGLATSGAHAMTIVGYDDTVTYTGKDSQVHTGAFIAVNTWSEYMHSRGRFYLPYHFFLEDHSSSVLSHELNGVKVKYNEPQLVFRVKVDYTSRDDLSFMYGFNDNWRDTIPSDMFIAPIADHQGGDHPMCGRYNGSVIEMGFDFGANIKKLEGVDNPNYFIDIQRSNQGKIKGEGRFLGFSVYDYREDKDHPKVYSCTDGIGSVLHDGHNYFSLMKFMYSPVSPVQWLHNGRPVAAPLVLKTASGKYAKLRFSDYDRAGGTIKLKYVYSPSGDRNLQ